MCLDFAARIVAREGNVAVLDYEGRRRRASTLLVPDAAVGDWVHVALGNVLERLAPEQARLINNDMRIAIGEME